MVAKDYLRQHYQEDYPQMNYFHQADRLLREKKRQQQNQKRGKRKKPSSYNNQKETFIRQNRSSFKKMNRTTSSASNMLKSIVDLSGKLLNYTIIAGAALFSLQGILRKTEYLTPEQSLVEGLGARVAGRAPDYGASGRSKGTLSEKGLKFIEQEEGLRTKAYKDSKGIWTIGIGHTGTVDGKPIHAGMEITEAKARELFKQDIKNYENYVNKVVKVPVTQNMFDAMVSYAFNVGRLGPKFLQKLNSGDYKGAMEELTTIDAELQNRRQRERALFGTDIAENNTIKGVEINPVQPKHEVTVTKDSDFNQLKGVKDVSSSGGHAKTYDDRSNITSHTKLKEGYNQYYDPSKEGMGTFMGKQITSGIGSRKTDGSSFHRGLDLSYSYGTDVRAFCGGVVTFAGVMSGFGKCILIDDTRRFRHLYGHLSEIKVSINQRVKKGDVIGKSGSSGTNAAGVLIMDRFPPHLHYGVWRPGGTSDKSAYVDPRTYNYPEDTVDDINQMNVNIKKAQDKKAKLAEQEIAAKNKAKAETNKPIAFKPVSEIVSVNPSQQKQQNQAVDIGKANYGYMKYDKNKPNKK